MQMWRGIVPYANRIQRRSDLPILQVPCRCTTGPSVGSRRGAPFATPEGLGERSSWFLRARLEVSRLDSIAVTIRAPPTSDFTIGGVVGGLATPARLPRAFYPPPMLDRPGASFWRKIRPWSPKVIFPFLTFHLLLRRAGSTGRHRVDRRHRSNTGCGYSTDRGQRRSCLRARLLVSIDDTLREGSNGRSRLEQAKRADTLTLYSLRFAKIDQ